MKELFNKDNFVVTNLEGKAKKHSLVLSLLLIGLFICSSFTFLNFLYCFSDIVGSIVSGSADVAAHDALRSVPLFLSFFETLWIMLLVHTLYRAESAEIVQKRVKKCLITSGVFAVIIILYVIIGLITGTYLSIVEGSPSALFPLDSILYSLLFVALAVVGLFFREKLAEKVKLELTPRTPVVRRARFVYCFFTTIWMLIALFGFSAFVVGLFIIDFKHDNHQFYAISLLLVYLLAFATLAFWELFYNQLTEEGKAKNLLKLGLISLCATVVVMALYFVSLQLDLDAPSNMGFGVLPVAYSASVNMATFMVILTPLIVSITAILKGLMLKKKNK